MSGHGLKVTVKKAKGAFSFVFVATYLVSFLASSFNSVLAKTNLKLPYLNCSLESASLSSINIPAGSAGSSWEWEPGRSQPRMRAPMPWCMLLYILHIYIYIYYLVPDPQTTVWFQGHPWGSKQRCSCFRELIVMFWKCTKVFYFSSQDSSMSPFLVTTP